MQDTPRTVRATLLSLATISATALDEPTRLDAGAGGTEWVPDVVTAGLEQPAG